MSVSIQPALSIDAAVETPAERAEERPPRVRDLRADALRGLAIMMVVLGHALSSPFLHSQPGPGRLPFYEGQWFDSSAAFNPVFNFIYTIHMPLFAFISALFVPIVGVGLVTLKRRFNGLIVPYLVWGIIGVLILGTTLPQLPATVARMLVNPRIPGTAWFLFVLFECYVVYVLLVQFGLRTRGLAAAAVITAIIGSWPYLQAGPMYGARDTLYLLPPFLLGALVGQNPEWFSRWRKVILAAGIPAFVVLCFLLWPVEVPSSNTVLPAIQARLGIDLPIRSMLWLLRYMAGSLGCVLIYLAYEGVGAGIVGRLQSWVGRRSLGIYVTHGAFLVTLLKYGVRWPVPLFFLTLAGALALTLLIERWGPARRILLGQTTAPPLLP